MKSIIAVTMGDACGVGPEIIVKAFSRNSLYEVCHPIVIGDTGILEKAVEITGSKVVIKTISTPEEADFTFGIINCLSLNIVHEELKLGEISAIAGDAAFKYINKAVELAKLGKIQAICTAPLNKEALHLGGHFYPGHTEILAKLTETEEYAMLLSSPQLKVIHLTTHQGLIEAIHSITPERTYNVIKLAQEVLHRHGMDSPRIAVCGINPHAGENGLFGNGEEEEKLIPGIKMATTEGINVTGPYPADTVFYRAMKGEFDIVVACYHDQGHIPIKLLGIEEGVNITVGLNHGIIRTSVDHGTAFDIAGKNLADESSLYAAIMAANAFTQQ